MFNDFVTNVGSTDWGQVATDIWEKIKAGFANFSWEDILPEFEMHPIELDPRKWFNQGNAKGGKQAAQSAMQRCK